MRNANYNAVIISDNLKYLSAIEWIAHLALALTHAKCVLSDLATKMR